MNHPLLGRAGWPRRPVSPNKNPSTHSLNPEERDELLQSLLVAASLSGETVVERLEDLPESAGREMVEGLVAQVEEVIRVARPPTP